MFSRWIDMIFSFLRSVRISIDIGKQQVTVDTSAQVTAIGLLPNSIYINNPREKVCDSLLNIGWKVKHYLYLDTLNVFLFCDKQHWIIFSDNP